MTKVSIKLNGYDGLFSLIILASCPIPPFRIFFLPLTIINRMAVSYVLEHAHDAFCEPCDSFKILLAEKAPI